MNKLIATLRKTSTGILLSILLGFVVGAIILAVFGYSPVEAYVGLITGIFGRPRFIVQTIILSTPLILTGLSVTFAFKTGLFNIGVEGQFIMGGIAASFLGYMLNLPPFIHPIIVMLGAMLIAGLYGSIVGFLKAKFGIHEVLSSIMLNWIALYFNNFYVNLPRFKRPNSHSVYAIQDSAHINVLYEFKNSPEGMNILRESEFLTETVLRTDLNYGIFIAIAAAILIRFILNRTTLGYTLKAVGLNKDAAEFAGINLRQHTILSMFISGALAGLASAVYITGISPNAISLLAMHENFGFNGIAVALIANANPIGNIFSALFYGGMQYGGGRIQSTLGIPSEIIDIMIGTIVFFIGMRLIFIIFSDKLNKWRAKND